MRVVGVGVCDWMVGVGCGVVVVVVVLGLRRSKVAVVQCRIQAGRPRKQATSFGATRQKNSFDRYILNEYGISDQTDQNRYYT